MTPASAALGVPPLAEPGEGWAKGGPANQQSAVFLGVPKGIRNRTGTDNSAENPAIPIGRHSATSDVEPVTAGNAVPPDHSEPIGVTAPGAPTDLAGVVETALAEALSLAARAGQWAAVAAIAAELDARRAARGPVQGRGELIALRGTAS